MRRQAKDTNAVDVARPGHDQPHGTRHHAAATRLRGQPVADGSFLYEPDRDHTLELLAFLVDDRESPFGRRTPSSLDRLEPRSGVMLVVRAGHERDETCDLGIATRCGHGGNVCLGRRAKQQLAIA
jgi:hypothetical protein